MLLGDAPLTLGEFLTNEELPLATVFREVMEFLREQKTVVLFGAHAVNAWCTPPRMTQDVDVMALDGAGMAEALREHLARCFHIAVRVREVVPGQGFRVYQVRRQGNRHLVDVRHTDELPVWRDVAGLKVAAPVELIAMKTTSITSRRGQPKGTTDLADLQRLLLAFPALKSNEGEVRDRLIAMGASEAVLARWSELAAMELIQDEDEGY